MVNDERSRRRFLQACTALGAVGFAGCMGTSDETTDSTPEATDTSEVASPASTETESESSATEDVLTRPEDAPRRLFEVTGNVVKEGDEIEEYSPTTDQGVSACLQTYIFEDYSSFENEYVWRNHTRLLVGVGPDETIEHVDMAYEKGYAPPSPPYEPTLDEVIQGEETENGISFDPQVSSEIRDVYLPFDLVEDTQAYQIRDDGSVLIPYDALTPYYLMRPLYDVEVTMTRSEKDFLLEVPQPNVSMTVQDITATETGDGEVRLREIAADVTMDSQKPTQYVNLHTNFGGSTSYDYGTQIEAENFTTIDGQGTTRVERDFTAVLRSVNQNNFGEYYPIERTNFDVVVGQVAPLATEELPVDRFIP